MKIVIGLGNPILKDDSVGIKVVERLGDVDADVEIVTTCFDVVGKLLRYDKAVIVDAMVGNKPGRIHVLNVDDLFVSYNVPGSHNLDLATSLKIGYEIFGDEMPREIKIVAIEVEDIDFGCKCSEEVEKAIPRAIEVVMEELK